MTARRKSGLTNYSRLLAIGGALLALLVGCYKTPETIITPEESAGGFEIWELEFDAVRVSPTSIVGLRIVDPTDAAVVSLMRPKRKVGEFDQIAGGTLDSGEDEKSSAESAPFIMEALSFGLFDSQQRKWYLLTYEIAEPNRVMAMECGVGFDDILLVSGETEEIFVPGLKEKLANLEEAEATKDSDKQAK